MSDEPDAGLAIEIAEKRVNELIREADEEAIAITRAAASADALKGIPAADWPPEIDLPSVAAARAAVAAVYDRVQTRLTAREAGLAATLKVAQVEVEAAAKDVTGLEADLQRTKARWREWEDIEQQLAKAVGTGNLIAQSIFWAVVLVACTVDVVVYRYVFQKISNDNRYSALLLAASVSILVALAGTLAGIGLRRNVDGHSTLGERRIVVAVLLVAVALVLSLTLVRSVVQVADSAAAASDAAASGASDGATKVLRGLGGGVVAFVFFASMQMLAFICAVAAAFYRHNLGDPDSLRRIVANSQIRTHKKESKDLAARVEACSKRQREVKAQATRADGEYATLSRLVPVVRAHVAKQCAAVPSVYLAERLRVDESFGDWRAALHLRRPLLVNFDASFGAGSMAPAENGDIKQIV